MVRKKVSTNRKNRFSWSRCNVDLMRLGKYFFNPNSGLFFPVRFPDSSEKARFDEAAAGVIGIKSLAAVYKHLEDDKRLRVVIAGHCDSTDDKGSVTDRYALSETRARVVRGLLTGEKDDWAAAVYEKHTVKDYKLLLKMIHLNKNIYFGAHSDKVTEIDPEAVDENWNEKTDKATRAFILGFNKYAKIRKIDGLKLSVVMKAITEDDNKRWPLEMWKAVFVLYDNALARTLKLKTKPQLRSKQKKTLKFSDDLHPFVSCGESFPLKDLNDEKKSGYDPEPGRGVEVFFFRVKELPGKKVSKKMRIICHDSTDAVHTAKQCPIFYKHHMKATFIDHRNLDLVIYHMKFVYFDRVKNEILPIPEGLRIKASHKNDANVKVDIDTTHNYSGGIYSLMVAEDADRKNIAFSFKAVDSTDAAKRYWVYTENAESTPRLVIKTNAEIAALTTAERFKYYDLPTEWSSTNYWTRYDGDLKKGNRFEKAMKAKKYKPYGSVKTDSEKPIIFDLDDIVLVDATGKQAITDHDGVAAQPLSANSRVALLYLDRADKYKIRIHKPIAKEPFFSDVKNGFAENLIHDHIHGSDGKEHDPCRVVVFCSDFYHVYDKRTKSTDPGFDAAKHVVGARAAKKDDADAGQKKLFNGWDAGDKTKAYVCDGAGYFDLQYLHNCAYDYTNNKIISALVRYWSCRFTLGTGGTNTDITNYTEKGMKNAIDRIVSKDYQMEKLDGSEDMIIKIFPLFEAKQEYRSGSTVTKRGGAHKCLVSLVRDSEGSSMGRITGKLRHSAYKDEIKHYQGSPADPPDPLNSKSDYDGTRTQRLTVAHELTHASGLDDDYAYSLPAHKEPLRYEQYYPGMPYIIDDLSLMNSNHAIRMRMCWLYANWINDEGAAAVGAPHPKPAGAMNRFFKGTKFKLAMRGGGFTDLELDLTDDKYRNIYKPAFEENYHAFGNNSAIDLLLYKLGDDEFANLITTGQKYKGILVVRPHILVEFKNGAGGGAHNWSRADIEAWLQSLNKRIDTMLNKKFRLNYNNPASARERDFSNVYILFNPHFEEEYSTGGGKDYVSTIRHSSNADKTTTRNYVQAHTRFKIEITKDGSKDLDTSALTAPLTGLKIEVGEKTDIRRIIRRIFGNTETLVTKMTFLVSSVAVAANLKKGDFDVIKTWIKGQVASANDYTIEDI